MPDVEVNGVRLYYEEHGEGDLIVCVHGTSSSALAWGDAVGTLAGLGRVIVYDRRGCTRSERPVPYTTTSVAEHADDLAALIETLGAVPAIVIGRSYGGEVALDLALRYPERVHALALLEPAVFHLSPAAQAWAHTVIDRILAIAERDMDAVAETFLRTVVGDATWETFPAQVRAMYTANGPAIAAELRGGVLEADQKTLASIDKPVLLVAGADSPPEFREITDVMAAAMPRARKALIDGGHHISPDGAEVLRFLEELTANRPPGYPLHSSRKVLPGPG